MKQLFLLILFSCTLLSCKKISPDTNRYFPAGSGAFILNEGNFGKGNGSVAFYSNDDLKVYDDLFLKINGRPLGDVPYSMYIKGEYCYMIVNNSGKIEVVSKNGMESVATISGLISPRNMTFIGSDKAYVTSMYSDSVIILDLKKNSISGYINLRRSSEAIAAAGGRVFISCWVGGSEVMVINSNTDKLIDSIGVGMEPESMVIDKDKTLWVLCNGGWARNNFAKLIGINTLTGQIEKDFVFPTKLASPSCLQIDGKGEVLFYLEKGVQVMNINASGLPLTPFINESGKYFYKIGINPVTDDIFVTDAVDYQQKGNVMIYRRDGSLVSTATADIIPGFLCFRY